MEFEHEAPGMFLRQRNVDPLLKSDRVNDGGQSQHKNTATGPFHSRIKLTVS